MEIREMNLEQVEERLAAISEEIKTADKEGLDALNVEMDAIEERKAQLKAETRAMQVASIKVAKGAGEVVSEPESAATVEVRSTKAYVDAFANYIKTGDDKECRALLTTMVSGQVPVPTVLESRIRTNWERFGLMELVRKTYVRGILKVPFELSATGADVHTEGSTATTEETLTFGVVTLTPESIKKWIKISDEAMDMGGEEFLFYIYDEITYQIAKKAQSELLAKIVANTASATSTAVAVSSVTGTPSVGIVAEALGELSADAANPVIVMNKSTWAKFKAAQYANNFNVDPFEGLPVYYDNSLPAYSSTATTGTWMIVGDFGRGAIANFPNGDEITIKYDDLSLAESDLVKLVGREYVGLGIVGDHAFCKVTMTTTT